MRGRRAIAGLLVGGIVVVAIAVVRRITESPERVSVIGDSITVMSAAEIEDEFEGRYSADIRARTGDRIDDMVPVLRDVTADDDDKVVVNLGTNDVLQGHTHPEWQPGFLQMVQLLADTDCGVIVNISTTVEAAPTSRAEYASAINAAIAEAARTHENLHVLDWDGIVHAPGGDALLLPDQVHVTDAGSRRLAREIRHALEDDC